MSGATTRQKAKKSRLLAAIVVVGAGLSGCSWLPNYANPIEWYRDATGISKYDDTGQERNAQNLAAGSKEPYPNLGTVPPLPDRAMSGVDRDKLVQGLVADRSHAKYSDDAVRAGRAVPPLPGEAPPVAMTQVPASAAGPAPPPPAKTAEDKPRHALPQRGSEPPPQEAPLESPAVRSEPQGETPLAAPPPPPGVPGHEAPPEQQAAATPPLPEFVPAPAAQPTVMRTPAGKHASVSMAVADIAFAGGGSAISADDSQHLAEAAKLHQEHGGLIRVVGYGVRGSGPDAAQQELASFSQALDRANAVAAALAKLGVPSKDIVTQAAPASAPGEQGVAVFLEY
jgi:outer membrane protein OmpA-like peptidoglycan-associated protein